MSEIYAKLSFLVVGLALSLLVAACSTTKFEKSRNGEHITLYGTVDTVQPDWFTLKSKNREILVEMDDFDAESEGYKLLEGDEVVVSGVIDHDFMEKKKIEAGSVYVRGIDTYFFANDADEESSPYLKTYYSFSNEVPENAIVELQGIVTDIDGKEFVLDTGTRKVLIDTKRLPYDPMDNLGKVQVEVGDLLRVSGRVDIELFSGRQLSANSIYEI